MNMALCIDSNQKSYLLT